MFINPIVIKEEDLARVRNQLARSTEALLNGCVVFTGISRIGNVTKKRKANGETKGLYGRVKVNGKALSVHRVAYALNNGGVLDGEYSIDHLCRNTLCVNPNHLELVTHAENNARGLARRRQEAELKLAFTNNVSTQVLTDDEHLTLALIRFEAIETLEEALESYGFRGEEEVTRMFAYYQERWADK